MRFTRMLLLPFSISSIYLASSGQLSNECFPQLSAVIFAWGVG